MKPTILVNQQKEYFNTHATFSYAFRLKQLNTLKVILEVNKNKIFTALYNDLNKSEYESFLTEYYLVIKELKYTIKNLHKWMRAKRVKTPITHFPSKSHSHYEPYGTVLIISPWNYPFQLTIMPLIGAIAAGNTAIIKTSRNSINVSNLLFKLINQAFDANYIYVLESSVTNDEVLEPSYDYIFFTGSKNVGRIIMEKASKTITPLTLELGGKSPCIIDSNININIACDRIIFGKLTNAGQTCVAPDYFLVHTDIIDKFLNVLSEKLKLKYADAITCDSYPKIINTKQFSRLNNLIKTNNVFYGGTSSLDTMKIEPTIIYPTTLNASIMQEEIFGPIFPIITYSSIKEIEDIVSYNPNPLALYVFSNNKNFTNQVIRNIRFGGGCINDTLMHVASDYLPFGGIGASGIGKYHGHHSFTTFSNLKGIVSNTLCFDLPFRYDSKYYSLIKFITLGGKR